MEGASDAIYVNLMEVWGIGRKECLPKGRSSWPRLDEQEGEMNSAATWQRAYCDCWELNPFRISGSGLEIVHDIAFNMHHKHTKGEML